MQITPQNNIPDEIDLWRILHVLLAKKWRIAQSVAVFLFTALLYLAFTPPVYEATTLVEVQPLHNSNNAEIVNSVERLLKRDSLFRKVVKSPLIQENKAWQQHLGRATELPDQAAILKKSTKVHLEKGTYLISISVQHSDPKLTKELATAIAQEFRKEQESRRNSFGSSDPEASLNPLAEFALSTTVQTQQKPNRPMVLLTTPVEVVEEAFIPSNPIAPNAFRVLTTAIILGGVVGLVLVWSHQVMSYMDDQARARKERDTDDSKDQEDDTQQQSES